MPSKKVVCPECKQSFSRTSIYAHRLKVHGVSDSTVSSAANPRPHLIGPVKPATQRGADGLWHCPDCGETFERKGLLVPHRKKVHRISPWQQDMADKWANQANLQAIQRTVVGPVQVVTDRGSDGLWHCPECSEGFVVKSLLGEHRAKRHGVSWAQQKRARQAQQGNKGKEQTNGISSTIEASTHQAQEAVVRQAYYIAGRVEGWIGAIAEGTGASATELTERVAELLRRKTRR